MEAAIRLEPPAAAGGRGEDPLSLSAIRQTMLRHEELFRSQVLELHRLHWTQRSLMRDVHFDNYGSCLPQLSGKSLTDLQKVVEREDESLFVHPSALGFLVGKDVNDHEAYVGMSSGIHPDCPRVSSARCSANEYTGSADKNSFDLNESGFTDAFEDHSIRNRNDTTIFSDFRHSGELINFDGSLDMEMDNENTVASFGMKTQNPTHANRNRSIVSENTWECLISQQAEKWPRIDQEGGCNKPRNLFFPMKRDCLSHKEAPFDLNVAQTEDLPANMEDMHVSCISLSASSITSIHMTDCRPPASKGEEMQSVCKDDFIMRNHKGRRFGQTVMIRGDSSQYSNSMLLDDTFGPKCKLPIDLNIVDSGDCNDFVEEMQPTLHGSFSTSPDSYCLTTNVVDGILGKHISKSHAKELGPNFQPFSVPTSLQIPTVDFKIGQAQLENSDEDTVSSKIHGVNTIHINAPAPNLFVNKPEQTDHSSSVRNSECFTVVAKSHDEEFLDPDSSLLDSSKQSQIPNLHMGSKAACSVVGNKDIPDCGIICQKGQFCDHGELETREQLLLEDDVVLMAAECLTFMSLQNPNWLVGGSNKQASALEPETSEQPQCSSDSLELIVLSLPEIYENKSSMRSVLVKEETLKSAARFTSRRIRQVQDFQKDILPGLVSLSRHEICEDMHAFTKIARLHRFNKETSHGICRRNQAITMRKKQRREH